jgi:YD repeat-containing protein
MRVTAVPNTIAVSYTVVYTYDANNRLITETTKRDGETETNQYAYDANGNQLWREWERSTLTTKGLRCEHAGFAGMHGGRTQFAPTRGCARLDTREYDGFNKLITVRLDAEQVDYLYRPDGLRHCKIVKNLSSGTSVQTLHHWDGQNMVMETLGNGNVKARYL